MRFTIGCDADPPARGNTIDHVAPHVGNHIYSFDAEDVLRGVGCFSQEDQTAACVGGMLFDDQLALRIDYNRGGIL